MTAFPRTDLFDTNTTLEQHLAHLIMAYRASVGNQTFEERSEGDRQPLCLYSAGNLAQEAYGTTRFLVCRLGIPLVAIGDGQGVPLYQQTIEPSNVSDIPNIYRAGA